MTKDQISLLLFLETQIVDKSGRVDGECMNDEDRLQAKKWNDEEFISFGRITSENCKPSGSLWVTFSDRAWEIAHQERRKRGTKCIENKTYQTTEEKRNMP